MMMCYSNHMSLFLSASTMVICIHLGMLLPAKDV